MKKIKLIYSLLFVSSISLQAIDTVAIEKLASIIAVVGAGGAAISMKEMNEEYSRLEKRPDAKMRGRKTLGAMGLVLGMDLLMSKGNFFSWKGSLESLAKIVSFGVAMLATTEPVARFCRNTPLLSHLSGFLTDPVDADGHEIKDFGATARFAFVYIPLRNIALENIDHQMTYNNYIS